MQLRVARLCLDCDEIHDQQTCPVCGSESFGFISRWVPAPERRTRPRPVTTTPAAAAYGEILAPDQAGRSPWLRRGVVGVTALSLVGWIWSRNTETRRKMREQSKDETIVKTNEGRFVR